MIEGAFVELSVKVGQVKAGQYDDMDDEEAVWLINTVWAEIVLRLSALKLPTL